MKIISPRWAKEMEEKLDNGQPIDVTTAFSKAVAWLVLRLVNLDRPFKIHNLGGGVKRITTDTDICPCCKKKL